MIWPFRKPQNSKERTESTGRFTALCITFLFLLLSNASNAQIPKETRVYYLDITGSMEPIWDDVTSNLKKAIENVNDETTTLEIVTWTDSKHELKRKKVKATEDGKSQLRAFIDGIELIKDTYTEVYIPFDDFYSNYGSSSAETYFYLMTDGRTYSKTAQKLNSAIETWKSRTIGTCYGFYVMLSKEAVAENIEKKVAEQDAQLWTVETADINIKHIKLERTPVYDVRNSENFDIAISGDLGGAKLKLKSSDSLYGVAGQDVVSTNGGKVLQVRVAKLSDNLPAEHQWNISISAEGLPKFTFLISKTVNVRCINKPYPTVKISFKD